MSKKSGKELHPLYNSWYSARRNRNLCSEWYDDFYLFVETIGERPSNHRLERMDKSKPFSPTNFKWQLAELLIQDFGDRNKYMREYRRRNPEVFQGIELKKRFGLSLDQYKQKLKDQNNVCAICGNPEIDIDNRTSRVRNLSVDHNHNSGAIRGLLCRGCNQGLGNFQEDLQRLKQAVLYLEKHNELSSTATEGQTAYAVCT